MGLPLVKNIKAVEDQIKPLLVRMYGTERVKDLTETYEVLGMIVKIEPHPSFLERLALYREGSRNLMEFCGSFTLEEV